MNTIHYATGAVVLEGDKRTHLEEIYQASHNRFVANALANKQCKKIIPSAMIGAMIPLSTVYPSRSKPEDIFGASSLRRRSLFFSDVMLRGEYPLYFNRIKEENNLQLNITQEELDVIKQYTSEYLGFSYYQSTTFEDGMPILI
jgi:6-phospho-beta-glucosidase